MEEDCDALVRLGVPESECGPALASSRRPPSSTPPGPETPVAPSPASSPLLTESEQDAVGRLFPWK